MLEVVKIIPNWINKRKDNKQIFLLLLGLFFLVACSAFPLRDQSLSLTSTPNVIVLPTTARLTPAIELSTSLPDLASLVSQTAVPAAIPTQLKTTPAATITATITEGNSWSAHPGVSADGRFVVFESNASNLVADDQNNVTDIFVYDRVLGMMQRVSVAGDGSEATHANTQATISADGSLIAFSSQSGNLVPGDTNNRPDIFVHNRVTGSTERVSVASNGSQSNGQFTHSPVISADGRSVLFVSDATNLSDILLPHQGNHLFVHDLDSRQTTLVDVNSENIPANGDSLWADISADGRFVVFTSWASNLTSDTPTEATGRLFVHDRVTGITKLIGEGIAQAISANGRYVAYLRTVENEGVYLFIYDWKSAAETQVSWIASGIHGRPGTNEVNMSADGRYVVFRGVGRNEVTNEEKSYTDIFLYDQVEGSIELISVDSHNMPANSGSGHPDISDDGNWVVFDSNANNLVNNDTNEETDVFIREIANSKTWRIPVLR
ncbi:MAG: hypothetical protein BroJett015_11650 [Chloroflexota bacterium]|nr:PD40 domain-containing protein [Ardenticatenaceae bacterium]GIK55502.1 MAG: hypothetical protein BroJett015_11650 [Chloroflexota bacterium]